MCGEKTVMVKGQERHLGSPPRMRGKGVVHVFVPEKFGITPACAGKSRFLTNFRFHMRDHPRVCGEKKPDETRRRIVEGSPPRMRGKAVGDLMKMRQIRITPAYAGKSFASCRKSAKIQDHPRVCGEKSTLPKFVRMKLGSPPRMRGKVRREGHRHAGRGITPAYAGKSVFWYWYAPFR